MTMSLQRMQGEEERSYRGRGTDRSYPVTDQEGTGKDKKGNLPTRHREHRALLEP